MKTTRKSPKTTLASSKGKTRATRKAELPEIMDEEQYGVEGESVVVESSEVGQKKKYFFSLIALFIIVALVGYKFKYLIVPAKVGNQPIFAWQYVSYMHKTYGKEALQTLSTQVLIEQEIAKSKVSVKPEDIQHEVDLIDQQASASGGIKAILAAQQMSMDQLNDQFPLLPNSVPEGV